MVAGGGFEPFRHFRKYPAFCNLLNRLEIRYSPECHKRPKFRPDRIKTVLSEIGEGGITHFSTVLVLQTFHSQAGSRPDACDQLISSQDRIELIVNHTCGIVANDGQYLFY